MSGILERLAEILPNALQVATEAVKFCPAQHAADHYLRMKTERQKKVQGAEQVGVASSGQKSLNSKKLSA
ncbi:hypothetical protein A2686_00520 [Candidatus Woesebacteria bacterium RIFCSPHIGHO2_01_FULL_38_10]|uniref:Uncharacterized protein n=1 Tax=Candidatus Woesebacteria bacterium RIFCSPLOWO2_01_FULL_39_10b TaxID=1802517 RepID=A0A1F8B6V2_9BACT|nr:MAG: hypothetical protein A2686_00520 [Candidatus Woesebacteria bacterium RIFCSPHIGHO2_01_FULL_38_10]OGM59429.1 MAG: hypothetical protein A2892_02150 [Candidatus Woesebacteria bacterium RIFCSPLOWO2_01_FULL_39_10b]